MTIKDWLKLFVGTLENVGIGTARLDALVLLEDVSGKDRGSLLAHPEFELTASQIAKLDKLIARRAHHEPLAYIRGLSEFYGREFIINKNVLEPRPESETIIDLLKQLHKPSLTIVDVGTGSGALAITAKLELPDSGVIGVDIDKKCLEVARKNAKKLGADVPFFPSDLLSFLYQVKPSESLILLCNLPYVPDNFTINPAAMNEPKIAIFGGPDGLNLYRKLFSQINELDKKPKIILAESMPPQHDKLEKIASHSGYKLSKEDDFIQLFSRD